MIALDVVGWSLVGSVVLVHLVSTALCIARHLWPRQAGAAAARPPISLLRPVCGLENHLEEALRSGLVLDYPDYEVIFCVATHDDPALPLLRRLIAEHPERAAMVRIGDDRISANPKLNNLVKGWRGAQHAWIVMADSNVSMPPDYLDRLLAAWRPETGLVCAPPIGDRPDGLWAELECAFLNTYQARWQFTADSLGRGFAQGKSMLWRRADLDAAGGIAALANEPAEDAAATRLVRRAGRSVSLVRRGFPQPLGRRRFGEVWQRQLRWARLRRMTFKAYFVPELLAGGFLPLAATAGLVLGGGGPGWLVPVIAGVWYGAEAALARAAGWHLSARSPLIWAMRDVLLPLLWAQAWMSSRFVWRGNAMNARSIAAESDPPATADPTLPGLRRRPALALAAAGRLLRSPARQPGAVAEAPPADDPGGEGCRRYRTLFLSDVHLGARGCRAEALVDFLRHNDAETIYLVGDIVDGWALKSAWYWPQAHNDVVQKLLRKVRKGTRIVYVPGNHDEFLRGYYGTHFGGIEVVERAIHVGADGRRYVVVHGDHFDLVIRHARWLALLGDHAYDAAIVANRVLNRVRRWLGLPYWSVSQWAKLKVKQAVNHIGDFERALVLEAKRHDAAGVICGHIHHAAIHDAFGPRYVNCGDWVESCTAIAEHPDGRLEIIAWAMASAGAQPEPEEVSRAAA